MNVSADRLDGLPSFDLSMLGEAELAAMESILATAGALGGAAADEPMIIEGFKDALTKARKGVVAADPEDELLGRALMNGGVSCSDGITLFENAHSDSTKSFFVIVAQPEKDLQPTALAKLVKQVQSAVSPGRAVVVENVVAAVVHTSSSEVLEGLAERVRSASVIGGAPCSVGASEPSAYFDLLSVCFDHARFAAKRAQATHVPSLSYEQCRFAYLVERTAMREHFAYVRDVRVLGLYESDCERGSDLLATVITYIQCGFNLGQTASEMHLHRNSVVYRLNRIAERSGIDLLGPYANYDVLTLLLTCKLYRAMLDDDAVPQEWIPSC